MGHLKACLSEIGVKVIASKQYRFKLQAVLDYRDEQLTQIQQRVSVEEHKRLLILKRIQEADTLIEMAFQEQQQLLTQSNLNLNQIQAFPNYLWRLKQSRFQEYQVLQSQERKLQIMREELKQAHIRKKSLELLKEKDQARYRQQLEKDEEAFMAEIALQRRYRQ